MPYRSSPASLARQRLIHDFPSWRVPDKPASRRGQPPSQPRETASAAGPTRPLLWLARREGLLLLVNESGGYLHRVKAVPYGYHLRDRMRLQVATDGDCYDYQRVPQEAPSSSRSMAPGTGTWSVGLGWPSRRPTWGA